MKDLRVTLKAPVVLDGRYLVVRLLRATPHRARFLLREVALGDWRALDVPAVATSDAANWRIVRAAHDLLGLDPEHVQQVHEVLNVGAAPGLVTELAPGGSVAEWMRRHGPLAPRRAAEVGLRIARALAACHAAGVAHRGVSPDSLLIRADGAVILGGFERARAGASTARWSPVDVLAFGETLHALCTGRRHAEADPPDCGPLAEMVERCCRPGARPPMAEVADLLERALEALPADADGGPAFGDAVWCPPDDPFVAWEAGPAMDGLRRRVAALADEDAEGITEPVTPVPGEDSEPDLAWGTRSESSGGADPGSVSCAAEPPAPVPLAPTAGTGRLRELLAALLVVVAVSTLWGLSLG